MKSKLTLAALVSVILSIAPLAYSLPRGVQDAEAKLPPGKWTLQHPVISQLGLKDAPLQITSVGGDVKMGGTIASVRLENNSGKAAASVRFTWYLFRDQAPRKILRKGKSPLLGLGGLANGSTRSVQYPIVSFGNIYKPLVKDGRLTGDFVLEVAVSEIIYEDGSRWVRR